MMRAVRIAEAVVAGFGRLGAGLLVAMALAQVGVLAARKAGLATVAAQEIVVAVGTFAVLLAVPWALQRRRHVAVDILASRTSQRLGLWLALALGAGLFALAAPYAWSAFEAGERSFEAGGMGGRWVVKAALPLFALLLAAQALASLARRR